MKKWQLLWLLLFTVLTGSAQPGTPITSFGNNGFVRTNFPNLTGLPTFSHFGNSSLYGSDGKLYAVVEINGFGYVSRWNDNGTLDLTYGNNGYSDPVQIGFPTGYFQPDGKMIITGFANVPGNGFDFALARLDANGKVDAAFGNGGRVTTAMQPGISNDWIYSAEILADGKIVVAGMVNHDFTPTSTADFGLARYNPDGSLDASFGNGGRVITPVSAGFEMIHSTVMQHDGKLVVGGYTGSADVNMVFARYLLNGSLDNSFDGDGILVINEPLNQAVYGITLQNDGKIVAAGFARIGNFDQALVLRLNANGTPDAGFNGTGRVVVPYGALDAYAINLRVQADGKIAGVGAVRYGTDNNDMAAFRLNANGAPDASFNGTGTAVVVNPNNNRANVTRNAMDLRADGKITFITHELMATPESTRETRYQLVRFAANGTLDAGFGTGGIASDYISQINTQSRAIGRQADGKLVVASSVSRTAGPGANDVIVTRMNPDGSPDMGFGTGGAVTVQFGPTSSNVNALLLQPDGKIVIGGNNLVVPGNTDFAFLRLNTNGTIDNSFGNAGRLTVTFNAGLESVNSMVLQPDGKIFAVGNANFLGGTGNDIAMVRLNPNGTPDASFGTNGLLVRRFATGSGQDIGQAAALQADGKLLVVGHYTIGAATKAYVMRMMTDGSLDNSFNGNGRQLIGFVTGSENGISIVLQPDGKILAGATSIGSGATTAVFRLNADGSMDNSFNGNGRQVFSMGGATLLGNLRLQADGKIVAAGRTPGPLGKSDWALARILPGGALDPSFNGNGRLTLPVSVGDAFLNDFVIHLNELYAVGWGPQPGTIGIIGAISLGRFETSTLLTVSTSSAQYSDEVTLMAAVSPVSLGNTAPASAATFSIGSRILGSAPLQLNVTTNRLEASLTIPLSEISNSGSVAPGVKTVTASFTAHPAFNVPDATSSLTITAEDAVLSYTGSTFVSTPNRPLNQSVTTMVPLRMHVKDLVDGKPGDIRRARVRFTVVDGTTITPIVTPATDANGWMPVQLVEPADSTNGTAMLDWNVTLAANDLSDSYTIGIEAGGMDGYYVRNHTNDRAVVTVSRADMQFITGGGTLQPSMSAGMYAATPGTELHFGFNAKYNRSGKNVKGKANIIFRREVNGVTRIYQIKADQLLSMGVQETGNEGLGNFTARANLFDITSPANTVQVLNQLRLQVSVTDRGEPGVNDELSVALYNSNGTLVMASRWSGTAPIQQRIASGNIKVSDKDAKEKTAPIDAITTTANETAEGKLLVHVQNLSHHQFTFYLSGGSNETIQIEISDASGKVLDRYQRRQNGVMHIGASYRPGIYFARVQQGGQIQLIKLVKQ